MATISDIMTREASHTGRAPMFRSRMRLAAVCSASDGWMAATGETFWQASRDISEPGPAA